MNRNPIPLAIPLSCLLFALPACHERIIKNSDRQVYDLLKDRQQTSIGQSYDVAIDEAPPESVRPTSQMYSFTPHPVDNELPEAFRTSPLPAEPPAQPEINAAAREDQAGEASPSIFTTEQLASVQTFTLSQAVGYAAQHARELQDAKEALYLAALDLTLERHLWTPLWVASIQADYANYGQVRDFDRAMSAVSDVAVTQRLPFGGEVAARVVNSVMRDLGVHTTSGESGNFIMSAEIPLFRGAGKVAYESRYAAERELIYAVRTFESFRRNFVVEIAGDYFALQEDRAAIENAYQSYLSRKEDYEKAKAKDGTPKSRDVSDLPRAKSNFRDGETNLVRAKETYEFALDRFKIRIGMEVKELLDVVDQNADEESVSIELLQPRVDEATATTAALKYRLDLVTSADEVDDARRGVIVAKNRILPDLNASGSATLDTDPEHLNSTSYNTERTTWRASMELRMDDRKRERTQYRAAVINVRQEERRHNQFVDSVLAEVRSSLRRVHLQAEIRKIQALNVKELQFRSEAAAALYDLGRGTNQDKIDAEVALLNARNEYARAVAEYRSTILQFRRDTGTLRIDSLGRWFAEVQPQSP